MTLKKKGSDKIRKKARKELVTIDIETCSAVRLVKGVEFKFHSPHATHLQAKRVATQLKEEGMINGYRIFKRVTIYCLYTH